jgi:hypothetical protein
MENLQHVRHVKSIEFQRQQGDEWEPGIKLNNGLIEVVLDSSGKLYTGIIWDFREVSGLEVDMDYVEKSHKCLNRFLETMLNP